MIVIIITTITETDDVYDVLREDSDARSGKSNARLLANCEVLTEKDAVSRFFVIT